MIIDHGCTGTAFDDWAEKCHPIERALVIYDLPNDAYRLCLRDGKRILLPRDISEAVRRSLA